MISVVIPTFNRSDSTLRLLDDVYRQDGVESEVIVVDDHSKEDPREEILARYPKTIVLRNDRNRGPAAARNSGVRAARGEIVVGFDSDVTLPDPNTLRKVAALFAEHPEVSGLAFRIVRSDGETDDVARWWHPLPLATHAAKSFVTSYFSGTAYAFRRDAMMQAGLFPEILFMHYEEVELAFQLMDQGGTIVYSPELVVQHHDHRFSRRSEIDLFYRPRNQLLIAAGCYSAPRALVYVTPRLVFQFFVAIRHGHVDSFFRALRSAGNLLPQRLSTRRVLKPMTWRRIAELRRVPRRSAESVREALVPAGLAAR